MSIDLDGLKPNLHATVLDIILKANMIKTETFNFTGDEDDFNSLVVYDHEIEDYIIDASGIVDSYLKEKYGAPTGIVIDSWARIPVPDRKNLKEKTKLLAVRVDDTQAKTSFWTVEFTSTTAFNVLSSIDGDQGSGTIAADFASDNSEISIGSNFWQNSGSLAQDHKFYFSLCATYSLVNTIVANLAASMVLSEKYSEAIPNESKYEKTLWSRAMLLIKNLIDDENDLTLDGSEDQQSVSVPVDYNIGVLGEDQSDYLTENTLDL